MQGDRLSLLDLPASIDEEGVAQPAVGHVSLVERLIAPPSLSVRSVYGGQLMLEKRDVFGLRHRLGRNGM